LRVENELKAGNMLVGDDNVYRSANTDGRDDEPHGADLLVGKTYSHHVIKKQIRSSVHE